MSMTAKIADLLAGHRLQSDIPNRRWVCSCGKKTYAGGARLRDVIDVHEQHQAEALVAAGVTPPQQDPRQAFLDRMQGGGRPS